MERTFAEFFAGIGLLRLGLEQAGWKSAFANDIDPKKFEMYWDNFQDAAEQYLLGDVHDVHPQEVPQVALATASFPCTDLSLAGYRKGLSGLQSGSFWGFAKLLHRMDGQRPPLVLLENVPGLLTSHGGRDFAAIIRALNELNYACDAFVLDAVNFVPQSRERLFVVAMFDAPGTSDVSARLQRRSERLRWSKLTNFMTERVDLGWRVLEIPEPPRQTPELRSLIERLPKTSERWWTQERVDYLLSQMWPRHRRRVDDLAKRGSVTYATAYRRVRASKSMAEVRFDGIAGCLRTPKGGSSRQILLAMGRNRIRARFLTPIEYARLMGAPEYPISVGDNQAYFGFGDAVCVPAIEWIGRNVLERCIGETKMGLANASKPRRRRAEV